MSVADPIGVAGATDSLVERRRAMVDRQLRDRGISSPAVLDAMFAVPRHEFVPAACREAAYADQPLPIGYGQTISQPLMVAIMTEALSLANADRVLEIGTGSGYQTAILAWLSAEVFTVEYRPELAALAWIRFRKLGLGNIRMRQGDGGLGWPEAAPFHKILVTAAAAATPPPPLLDQLAEGGLLVVPLGDRECQELVAVQRRNGRFERRHVDWCRFVPLVGLHGSIRLLAG